MNTTSRSVDIAGAGLAGLSAAITAGRAGARATVFDRDPEIGHRFHGEFQGLENWTTKTDVLEELATIGIEPTFRCVPYYETVLFDPTGREHVCRDAQPIFYLVERGSGESTVDRSLYNQALMQGAKVHFKSACSVLPQGGIVACRSSRASAITVGYLFETDAADGAYCSLSPRHAMEGYAYLLVHRGRGVVASCLFGDFHNERYYLGQAVEFFETTLAIKMRHLRRFAGASTYSLRGSARRNVIMLAGETAGLQDALAGFGIRSALISGHLAAEALLNGKPSQYDKRSRERFGPKLRASLVNRYLYARAGTPLRVLLATHLARTNTVRFSLRQHYANSILKSLMLPFARHALVQDAAAPCTEPGCHCTWCQCESSRRMYDCSVDAPAAPFGLAS